MKIGGFESHPAADLYPMLAKDEIEGLAEDIANKGLEDEIVLTREKVQRILDGRNRLTACLMAKVKPRFTTWQGKMDMDTLVSFVESKNDRRRHLTASQRAMIGAMAAKLRHGERPVGDAADKATQEQIAKSKNVSSRSLRYGRTVLENAPPQVKEAVLAGKLAIDAAAELAAKLPRAEQKEIAARIMAKGGGEVKSGHVRALIRQKERRGIVRRINAGQVGPMPLGPFGLIYGDYPWPFDNCDQHDGSRGHMGYPPMPMDQIISHAREAASRAAKNCVLGLWYPNAFVHEIGRVVDAYGATVRTQYTWPKPRWGVGGWGRGQTEHIVIASIGDPVHTLNEVSTLLPSWEPEHPGEHSSKPAEMRELLAKHCGGPFLEMFAREERDGWACWGAETEKFTRAA